MKNLTISTDGNGRFSYSLDGESIDGEFGIGLDWGQIKQVLRRIEPATAQGDDHISMVSGHLRHRFGVSVPPKDVVSAATQELRLECVRLAIMAGVPHDRVISWAADLETRVTGKNASHRATCANLGPAEGCYCQHNKTATAS